MKNYTVIIVAAGNSSRFNQKNNKILYKISNNISIIEKTIEIFLNDKFCTEIIVGVNKEILDFLNNKNYSQKNIRLILGGKERADTVYKCLINQELKNSTVMIHDGIRCFITNEFINKLNQNFHDSNYNVLVPIVPITEALKKITNDIIEKTLNRDNYVVAQTPQVFNAKILITAYQKYLTNKIRDNIYDDSYLIELFNKDIKIHTIIGEKENIKITYFDDLKLLNLVK